MTHIDFEQVNVVWGWVKNSEEYIWESTELNNAIAGDTDSIMILVSDICPEGSSIDDAVEIADAIGRVTNESFPDFCMHAFNCPATRKSVIKTDREVVSDKSLFLSKKRYVMHVVDSEGERVDKLKITGVEIKKSDTSKAIKSILTQLVNHLLDGISEEGILRKIKEFKSDFMKLPPTDIAKPINVKTLGKCQRMFEADGSMKGFPYQVRAAMFWNKQCGNTDKRIVPGDKIGLLYIKHPETKYIGFPVDMTKFPEWFSNFRIDYDVEWEKANDKIESYLESVGWDLKSKKDSVRMGLFGF